MNSKINLLSRSQPRSHRAFVAYGLIAIMLTSIAIQVAQPFATTERYELSAKAKVLTGESRDDTTQNLIQNEQTGSYEFAIPQETNPEAGGNHYGRNADVYSTSLPLKASEGITYTDGASKIAITIAPKFRTGDGQKVTGDHIVYPYGSSQLVYTHKYNGLKEDIIVPKFTKDSLSYEFKLQLPSGVEARLDAAGNIGIYSSDPTLFGEISYGSDTDRARLDKARQSGDKTHLVATIPAPIVKDAESQEYTNRASFNLSEQRTEKLAGTIQNVYALGIEAKNLKDLPYPISIDPTIQSTSASDFASGTSEGGVDIDTANGLIRRSGLTGGEVNTWTAGGNSAYTGATQSAVHNGKLYVANEANLIMMADINPTTGALGVFSSTGQTSRQGVVHIYRGYFYFLTTGTGLAQHVYAKINANGTLGSFVSAGPDSLADRENAATTIYNGYAYLAGGASAANTVRYNTVQYAPVNADGTLGSWQAAASTLTNVKNIGKLAGYNGMLYLTGGVGTNTDGVITTAIAEVEFSRITNGVPGQWTALNSFSAGRFDHGFQIYNGYLYVYGGWNGNNGTDRNDVQYAAINADGTINGWRTSTAFAIAARRDFGDVVHKGTLYVVAGQAGKIAGLPTATYQDIQYTSIKPAGTTSAYAAGTSFATARGWATSVYAAGYVYIIGGCSSANGPAECSIGGGLSSVQAAFVNNDGTIGAWVAKAAMPGVRYSHASAVNNGIIYVSGGCIEVATACSLQGTTYYATITNSLGDISWATDPNINTTLRREHALAAAGGYLYAMGGYVTNAMNSVEKTSIGTGGGLSAWSATSALPQPLHRMGATTHGGQIYTAGDNTVYRAEVAGDGSLTWFTAGPSTLSGGDSRIATYNGYLYQFRGNTVTFAAINSIGNIGTVQTNQLLDINRFASAGVIAMNGSMHVIGGCGSVTNGICGSILNSVSSAQINNGGSGVLASYTGTSNFSEARSFHKSVTSEGYIYVLGGRGSTGSFLNDVQYAKINADGSLGAWAATSSFTTGVWQLEAVAYKGYMYVLGGGCCNNPISPQNSVQYAKINADGTLQTWASTTSFSGVRFGHTAVANNGYLYVLGGCSGGPGGANCSSFQNDVQYAPISSNGTVGVWTGTTSFSVPREGHTTVVLNGFIYVIAGCSGTFSGGNCTTTQKDVQYAPLNTNGSVGLWKKAANLSRDRYLHTTVVSNGFIYVLGGGKAELSCSGSSSNTEYAAVNAGGSTGLWADTTSVSAAYCGSSAQAIKGNIYILGGWWSSSGIKTSVDYAPQFAISRKGSYSRMIDFDKGVRPTKLITRGTAQGGGSAIDINYMSSNNESSGLSNPQTAINTGYGGNNAVPLSLGAGRTLGRYLLLNYSIDDSQSATFPELADQSTITDYDIYYDPNPGSRLRNGRTFTGGQDRGLQVTP